MVLKGKTTIITGRSSGIGWTGIVAYKLIRVGVYDYCPTR